MSTGQPGSQPYVATSETHVSVVFFVGDRAFKLKKPVSMAFLDFSTRQARLAVCHREVELNRRLAPDVYLGVADIIGPDGNPLDHLVVMRRMPPDRRLSALVAAEQDVAAELRQIARVMARFHASAESSGAISAAATLPAIRATWQANLTEMLEFRGSLIEPDDLDRIEALALRYLEGRERLFSDRIAKGKIRDCHGDLLADDIFCLPDGPRILDCIEFDDTLRHTDVVADIAFLAMDLERLGALDAARQLWDDYREFSADVYPQSLVHHYVALRALIRSKVACLRHRQRPDHAAGEARGLAWMARRHLENARVRLVLVGGLPGTGKTTLASELARRTGWVLLRSDEIRKELAGIDSRHRATAGYREGLYTPEVTSATYEEMLSRARLLCEEGQSVILDASWSREADRLRALQVAGLTASDATQIVCVAPPEVTGRRMDERLRQARDASDATRAVAERMAADFDGWAAATPVDTTLSEDACVEAAMVLLRDRED